MSETLVDELKINTFGLEAGEEAPPAQQYVFVDLMSCRKKVVLTVGYIFIAVASFFLGVAITRQVNGKGQESATTNRKESCGRLRLLSTDSICEKDCFQLGTVAEYAEQKEWVATFEDENKVVFTLQNMKDGNKTQVSQEEMEEEIIAAAGGPGSGEKIDDQEITLPDGRQVKTSLYIFPLRLLGVAVGITLTVLLSSWQGFVAGCALALFTIMAELVIKCYKQEGGWNIGKCMKTEMTSYQFWKDSVWNLVTNVLAVIDPTFSFISLAIDGVQWARDVTRKLKKSETLKKAYDKVNCYSRKHYSRKQVIEMHGFDTLESQNIVFLGVKLIK